MKSIDDLYAFTENGVIRWFCDIAGQLRGDPATGKGFLTQSSAKEFLDDWNRTNQK